MPRATEPVSETVAEFGLRARARRHELGLSQEGLAERSGVHWTYVSQLERGQNNPSLHNIVRLARGLGVEPGVLLDGLPQPPEVSER